MYAMAPQAVSVGAVRMGALRCLVMQTRLSSQGLCQGSSWATGERPTFEGSYCQMLGDLILLVFHEIIL